MISSEFDILNLVNMSVVWMEVIVVTSFQIFNSALLKCPERKPQAILA